MAQFDHKNFEQKFDHKIKWTRDELTTLKEKAKAGSSLSEIARAVKHSKFAVIMRLRKISHLETPYDKKDIPEEFFDDSLTNQDLYKERFQKWQSHDNEILKARYASGENMFSLAKYFHRSPTAILLHIQELYDFNGGLEILYEGARRLVGKKLVKSLPKVTPIEESNSQPETTEEATTSHKSDYAEKQREIYENFGKPWTKEDDDLLVTLYKDKQCPIDLIMQVFKRNRGGIIARLKLIGFEIEDVK